MESKRQLQIGETIRRDFSIILQQEGAYIYGKEPLVSVTNVIMSPDLGIAKIYVSIFNTINKQEVLILMNEAMHRLKQQLYHRIKKRVRRVPRIEFYIDDTLDEMDDLNKLFDRINNKS